MSRVSRSHQVTSNKTKRVKWVSKGVYYVMCAMLTVAIPVTTAQAQIQVNQVWVARYDGPGHFYDEAHRVVVDATGNVYVIGYSPEFPFNGDYSVVNNDYATVKYDANGNQLWVSRYNGPGGADDAATGLAVDAAGNVYVTGYSTGLDGPSDHDYATIKYDANGNQLWVVRYSGGYGDDMAQALSIDTAGNVYVTGSSVAANGYTDAVTIKYDANGNQVWLARYNGPGNAGDGAGNLVVDALGNVYVAGGSQGQGSNSDYVTVKYDASGNQTWVARYNGPGNAMDWAVDLEVDAAGKVYMTGYSQSNSSTDYATVKYAANGDQLWVARYNGPGNGADTAADLAVDALGNVFVTGSSVDTNTDPATVKYDANGNQLWVARYYGPINGEDGGGALKLDSAGNVYVAGTSFSSDTYDYVTIKYDTYGQQVWEIRYDGPGGRNDSAQGLFVDTNNNVYVTGYSRSSNNPNTSVDFATIKYVQDGDLPISQSPADQRFPWADYNETVGAYLVLWQDKRNGSSDDIYGVRLDRNGNKIGSEFAVSTASGHQQRVLVKAGDGGWLAVWHDLRNNSTSGADIYGVWISGDGTVGSEMAICSCATDQWNPVAGYDPQSGTFLVTWLDSRGSVNNQTGNINDDYDLYGAVIPVAGSTSVSPFPLITAVNGQRGPQIGYDWENGRYYLVWNDRRGGVEYDLYGARISPSGVSLDGNGRLLVAALGNQFRPTVTDRIPGAGVNNYLVAWTDYRNGTQADVYGIFVDGSGNPVGSDFTVSNNGTDKANAVADLDWIRTKKVMVGFITGDGTAGSYDIYRAQVDTSGGVTGDDLVSGAGSGVTGDQRAEVVSYATDGVNDFGFLVVWMDRRNGTDYDIWARKVWP